MEKPLKIKICSQIFLLPIYFLQNIFASQYSFLPLNDFFTRKKISKNFAGKISSPKESAPPKHAPQNFLPRKFLSKKNVPHFAPLIFILKNLLPQFFLPRISCQTFFLSIFLLTMKFYLQKILQNTFAGEISSSQESLLQNLVPKISSQEKLL